MTFSSKTKNELSSMQWAEICCIKAEITAALVCSARFGNGQISIATAHEGYSERLSSMINEIYATSVKISRGSELFTILCDDKIAYKEILEDLEDQMSFNSLRGTVRTDVIADDCCGRSFLRGAFLSTGSVSDPDKSYHLELAIRRISVAKLVKKQLLKENINARILKRGGYHVLYLKEGQQISDFLLTIGAHKAMLDLESLMVHKSVRNTVNRMVNCDTANIDRITATGTRQLEAIRYIENSIGLDKLSDALFEAATLRLQNPDLSIKELGELIDPPLGKSGMNHRLKKLELIAMENKKCQHK